MAKKSETEFCDECGVDMALTIHKPWCTLVSTEVTPSYLNQSGIMPQGQAILLLPYTPEVKSSAIIVPDNVKRQMDMVEMRGTVIEIGPDAWLNEMTGYRGTPRARIGDKVLVSKFCGALVRGTLDDVQYRMINGRDIYAVIVSESDTHRDTSPGRESMQEESVA